MKKVILLLGVIVIALTITAFFTNRPVDKPLTEIEAEALEQQGCGWWFAVYCTSEWIHYYECPVCGGEVATMRTHCDYDPWKYNYYFQCIEEQQGPQLYWLQYMCEDCFYVGYVECCENPQCPNECPFCEGNNIIATDGGECD